MQFDFNVGANQSQHIDVVGTFIKYKAGTGLIRVRLNGGGYIDLLPGQGVNNVNFTSVDVQDRTGAQNVGTILAGIYDFRDDRITGTVDVVDGGKARTLANTAFMTAYFMAGSAGNCSTAQLWNPPGNMRVIVPQFYIASDTAGPIRVGWNNQVFATPGHGYSKLAGGANAVSGMNGLFIAPGDPAPFGPGTNRQTMAISVSANQNLTVKLVEPVVLPPGYGLIIQHSVVAATLNLTIEYDEEPV